MRSKLAAVLLLLTLGAGCASGRMSDREPDRLFREGRYDDAAAKLEEGLKHEGLNGRDSLLWLLDLGLTLHTAGRYEESNKYFLEADKIAEIKDYTSLSTEGATLLTSDNLLDYKGEDFEKVLINTYLAMNYALMGKHEDALVEARRVNHKLHLMVTEGKRQYKQNAFARYLSAVLYEADGSYDDAYIDYKNAYELEPDFPNLKWDLWRLAWLTENDDDMEKWDDEFHLTKADHEAIQAPVKAKQGEIVVIYENGISPIKRPNPNFRTLPKFYPRYNPVQYANVEVNGQLRAPTAELHDIEATAIENLDEKYGGLIAKKIGGIVAKEVVADQIGKHTDPLVGFLAKVVMYASDQADVRSWNLLPRDLQLARFYVDPGTYTVRVLPVGADPLPQKSVTVEAGRKVLLDFRYTPP